jgi:hypothetical protein
MQEVGDFLARNWWVALVAAGLLVLRFVGESVLEMLVEVVWAGLTRLAAVVWDGLSTLAAVVSDNLRGPPRRRRRGRHRAGRDRRASDAMDA